MAGNPEGGYKKPPRRTRFKKGKSGNPKGRPKGTKNITTDLKEVLQEPVRARVNNQERMMTKQLAMVTNLVNNAAKGEPRAVSQVFNVGLRYLETDMPEKGEELNVDERAILENFKAEILREALKKATPPPAADEAHVEVGEADAPRSAQTKAADDAAKNQSLLEQALAAILGRRSGGSSHAR